MSQQGNIFSIFSSNSETFASELLEDLEENFLSTTCKVICLVNELFMLGCTHNLLKLDCVFVEESLKESNLFSIFFF